MNNVKITKCVFIEPLDGKILSEKDIQGINLFLELPGALKYPDDREINNDGLFDWIDKIRKYRPDKIINLYTGKHPLYENEKHWVLVQMEPELVGIASSIDILKKERPKCPECRIEASIVRNEIFACKTPFCKGKHREIK